MSAPPFVNKRVAIGIVLSAPMIVLAIIVLRMQLQALAADQSHAVEVQMRNVMYHFTDSIAVHIGSLSGRLTP